MRRRNPFRPSFGTTPPLLVGRDAAIAEYEDALDDGPGSAALASLVTGQRGTGKTVLLNALEDQAKSRGWLVISETADTALIDRLTSAHLPRLLAEHDPQPRRRRLLGASAASITMNTSVDDKYAPTHTLRSQMELLTDLLAPHQTGVLITIDEVHAGDQADLRELFTSYQHWIREDRAVSIVAAGLPQPVEDLLADPVLTFLRRAHRIPLGQVDDGDVAQALQVPIRHGGREIAPEALDVAVKAVRGYPFLIQLVGKLAWDAHRDANTITTADAQSAATKAPRRMGEMVHAPALHRLSPVDRSYLAAIAVDDGPSRTADIAARMNVEVSYTSAYRNRMITAELIHPTSYGYVDFTLPYLREYLREHIITEIYGD